MVGWHHWLNGHWASSRSWWRTGNPGVLQSMRSQRVGHDWVTEQHVSKELREALISCILDTFLWNRMQDWLKEWAGRRWQTDSGIFQHLCWEAKRKNKIYLIQDASKICPVENLAIACYYTQFHSFLSRTRWRGSLFLFQFTHEFCLFIFTIGIQGFH